MATALGGAVTGIISAFDAGVTALNLQIQTLAAAVGYDVADVCSTFRAENTAANPLCNATLSPDVNMDIHPNAAGHAVIAAVMASALAGEPPAETALPFTDVAEGDWFYDAVAYVYGQGIMTGTSDTAFSPNLTTTRGHDRLHAAPSGWMSASRAQQASLMWIQMPGTPIP